PAGRRVRLEQLESPGVVADAVDEHVVRLRERSRILWRGVVVVRIGVRIGDDARHLDVLAAHLRGDAAPEVLNRHDLHSARDRTGRGAQPAGREQCQENTNSYGFHASPPACDIRRASPEPTYTAKASAVIKTLAG